jgi:hypothetical protein
LLLGHGEAEYLGKEYEQSSSPHGRQRRRQRKTENMPYEMTHFFPTILHLAQYHHLPTDNSNFESIKGLNHLLSQSHHDPIVSGNAITNTATGVLY